MYVAFSCLVRFRVRKSIFLLQTEISFLKNQLASLYSHLEHWKNTYIHHMYRNFIVSLQILEAALFAGVQYSSQNSLKSLIKRTLLNTQTHKGLHCRFFQWVLWNSSRSTFCRTPQEDCFWKVLPVNLLREYSEDIETKYRAKD